jgi:hypothetical protein
VKDDREGKLKTGNEYRVNFHQSPRTLHRLALVG